MTKPNQSQNKVRDSKNNKRYPKRSKGPERTSDCKEAIQGKKGSEPYNDPKWRMAVDPVGTQVHQYSFCNYIGQSVRLPSPMLSQYLAVEPHENVASIGILSLNPSPGETGMGAPAMGAAINQQGLRTFTALSAGNAKTTNYAPQDVTTCLLAIGELISTFEYARRAMGVAYVYNVRNREFPRHMIQALGIDPDDLIKRMAEYRIRFNMLALQASKIPFPANIRYFDACRVLYQDLFLDSPDSAMAQVYAFKPCSTWYLDETSNPNGTQLTTEKFEGLDPSPNIPNTNRMQYILDVIERQLNCLMTSATLNYVYSDVLRLAEKQNIEMFHIAQLEEGYSVMPRYDAEAILQIENATIVGEPIATGAVDHTNENNVVHDPNLNCVNWHPVFQTDNPGLAMGRIFSFDSGDPKIEERVAASRFVGNTFVPIYDSDVDGFRYGVVYVQDHYVTEFTIYWTGTDGNMGEVKFHNIGIVDVRDQFIDKVDKFNHHPKIYMYTTSGSGESKKWRWQGICGDLNYWTVVDIRTVKGIIDAAFFELFELK